MRPDLTTAQRTLLESDEYDVHWQVFVANGSGTLQDLSLRVFRGSYTDPSPDQPIGTAQIVFRRGDGGGASLAPLVTGSSLNKLDDGTTYGPLLHPGRAVVIKSAVVARGSARPSSGYVEVFRGIVDDPDWSGRFGDVSITCRDQAGKLQTAWIETERTYTAGTALETAMKSVLNDNGFSSVVLNVPSPTGASLPEDYVQQKQSVWDALQVLARTIGWVCWYRYDATGTAKLTLFEPPRSKTVSDYTFGTSQYYDVTLLNIESADIRNVISVPYVDGDGAQRTVTAEDPASIEEYGGIRRFMEIGLTEKDPIRSESQATSFISKALSDLKDPDAVQEIKAPYFWPGECAVDLYTFRANGIHYDSDQAWAPFSIRHEFEVGKLPLSHVKVRGKPSGGSSAWFGRGSGGAVVESDRVYALNKFRPIRHDADTTTFGFEPGAKVEAWWRFEALQDHPYSGADPWPSVDVTAGARPTRTGRVGVDANEDTISNPPQGKARYVRWVPYDVDGNPGRIEQERVLPTLTQPDEIRSLTVSINDADGSATLKAEVVSRCASVRFAHAVGSDPSVTDAQVESGTVVAVSGGVATRTLPAGTVAFDQWLRAGVAGYTSAGGVGADGTATDHGEIRYNHDFRVKPPTPTVEPRLVLNASRSTADGYVTVRSGNGVEQVRLHFKDSDASGATVWSTAYVASGTEVGPATSFSAGAASGFKLDEIALSSDAVKRIYVQAEAKDSATKSDWWPMVLPSIQRPSVAKFTPTAGAAANTSDLSITVTAAYGQGGTLEVWTNKSGTGNANPGAPPDATLSIASTPATVGPANHAALDEIVIWPGRGKVVYARFVAADGGDSGTVPFTLNSWLDLIGSDGKLVNDAIDRPAAFAASIRPPKVVSALPANNADGNLVYLTTDYKLYRWNAATSSWTVEVDGVDIVARSITGGKLAVAAVGTDELAAGSATIGKLNVATVYIQGMTLTANTPSAGSFRVSNCTAYYQGTAYAVAGGDISGEVLWWTPTAPNAFQVSSSSGLEGAGYDQSRGDQIIVLNENGTPRQVWNGTRIYGGHLTTDAIKARHVSALNLEVGKYIRSNSYVAGSSGWNIHADGSAEFNNVTVRGTVYASAGEFGGTVTASSFTASTAKFSGHIQIGGELFFGSESKIAANSSGIYFYAGTVSGVSSASIDSAGKFYIFTLNLNSKDVSEGANDSGGTGYRVLRVPNA